MKAFPLLLALTIGARGLELTKDTWDEQVAGKTVFIKFFAPWCGHCKKLKPDWDKLMAEFKGSETALIADVDCTRDEGKDLCEEHGVQGFPSIKYGDPSSLEDYEGGRSYKDLLKFAKENLGPKCGPANLDLCDDEKKALIGKYEAMSDTDLAKEIEDKDAEIKGAEKDLETLLESLQKQYEDGTKAKDEKIKEIKAAGLGFAKAVKANRGKKGSTGEL